ncbi:hypothetical protein SAMN02746065_101220 [Desulfocicer vacuolatum DSM 3385]|uniref:diguanylate cyclase n=1 Tax=Desulfocicer vacuolatum DSM 3385 TaxID=1121400 RepID=A0A1W1YPI3_9BACT|nr:GGDEF domain-containing protein [Desulfocicer vacuolatum]SMC37721.1 hypothetical protein SAMN02746065_101220 [Desulfocicer vacuolatum DSM 3385]
MMNETIYLEKFKLLTGMAMLLQSCDKEEELFDVIFLYLPKLFPDVYGEIFLQDTLEKEIHSAFVWGKLTKEMPMPDFEHCRAFACGVVVNTSENRAIPCEKCRRGECCIPFCDGSHAFGILCLSGATARIRAGYRGLAFVTAEYLALAIVNLRLKKRLHELTLKDPLTGLFNRRHMDETVPREIIRAKRAGASLGAIMVDLDYFKDVNDSFGHDAGDEVLKKVGHFLKSAFRVEDLVCRFGGEEFFILMTSGEAKDYCARARKLREGIKGLDISWEGRQISPVTASLGVVVFPDNGKTFEELLHRADQALYLAKAQGRDRVILGDNEA